MLQSIDTLIAFGSIMLIVSLLITIAVQMLSSALNLRGINMLMGLSQTLQATGAVDKGAAASLSHEVLRGRILSDSSLPNWPILGFWRWASAVRPHEVFDSIHGLATDRKPATEAVRATAQQFLIALGMDPSTFATAAATVAEAKKAASDLETSLASVADARVRDELAQRLKVVQGQLDAYAAAEASRIVAATVTVDQAFEKFDYWYGIALERAQQWFTTHTRLLTICCAIVFALWLQLDTVEVFRLVSADKTLRDQLVAQSGVIGSQAERVVTASPGVLQRAYTTWLGKIDPSVKAALANVSVQPNDTRKQLSDRIASALPGTAPKAALLRSFNQTVDDTAMAILRQKAGDYAQVRADFQNTSFDLFPRGAKGRWGNGWWAGWRQHWAGLLFSIGLLSLGAPFWYNLLKGLTSLRSTVAQNMAEEKAQDTATVAPGPRVAAAPAQAPPTTR